MSTSSVNVVECSSQKIESRNLQIDSKQISPCIPFPIPPPNPRPEVKFTKIFVNNQWMDSSSDEKYNDICPSTESVIAEISQADCEDVNKAVLAAKEAFEPWSPWRKMDSSERGVLLLKLADKIDENKYYLACLESLDSGKPYTHTFFMDTLGISKILRYYAGWCDKIHGKTLPIDGEYMSFTKVLPIGVCGLILPWNMPLVSLAMKLGPALCCGNTVVIKPAEQTPLTTLFVASLAKDVGFPSGVINVLPGGAKTGAAIAMHQCVNKVSFTGSLKVGRQIEEAAAKSNLKRLTLELSGKCPIIIFSDVNVEVAVEQAHQAAFMNQGQMCTAGSRTYVHSDIYDEFVRKSVARAKKRVVASPFEMFCEQGPQISREHFDRVMAIIGEGINEGAKLEYGGSMHGEKGLYIQPTVFSGVEDWMKIAREEIFGPVQCIFKFSTVEEVVCRANDTKFGLAAGVFTNDIDKAFTISNCLHSGTVWINCYNAFAVQSPFGGCKLSGKGKEMGKASIKEFSDTKTITLRVSASDNILKKREKIVYSSFKLPGEDTCIENKTSV